MASVTIDLPDNLHRRFKVLSDREGKSMASILRKHVERIVSRMEKKVSDNGDKTE